MLTPQKIQEMNAITGLNKSVSSNNVGSSRAKEILAIANAGNTFKDGLIENKKTQGIATDLIGGQKLAEGAGLAIASPKIQQDLSEAELRGSDIALNLTKLISQNKKQGKDTSKLELALSQLEQSQTETRDVQKDFVDALPTNKEVIGSTARLAGTLSAGGIGRGASALTGAGKATTALSGIVKGTGAGILAGGTQGVIQGAGLASEQNKSTEDIISSGLLGGATGAVLGGVIGGVSGGIAGKAKATQLKKESFTTNLASEKLSAKERTEAIYRGRLKDAGLFKKAELDFSKRDVQLGDSIRDVVNPKATLGENVDAIRNKISNTNNGVKDYILKNKVPFNTNQLKSQLETGKGELDLIFASDTNAEKTYDAVSKAFLKNINKKDTAGLFEARQTFDQIPAVKKLLDSDKLGENARKEIVLAVRRSANEYIASLLPKNNPYQNTMKLESYMQEALGNIAQKGSDIIGKNKLQLLTQEYPILKWLIGGIATGIVGAAGVGVGSSIVSSTD